MAKKLTSTAVENARPGAKRREVPDGLLTGLYLIVQPLKRDAAGNELPIRKSWAVRYRSPVSRKPVKLTLGGYPALSLKDAREDGGAALRAVAAKRDPAVEKRAAEIANRRDDIAAVVDEFILRYAKANTRASSAKEAERMLRREVVLAWKGRTIQNIVKRDVVELLDGMVDRGSPIAANRLLAHVRKMFNWAVSRDVLAVSPCNGVEAPTAEVERDRKLSDAEVRLVWIASGKLGWPFGPLVRLLLLTGQRRNEVAGLKWSEIDFDKGLWTLPRERVKNDVAHEVPLSPQALTVLKELPRIGDRNGLIFTTTGTTPVSGFSRWKLRLDAEIAALIANESKASGNDPVQFPPWVIHDLRRTVASNMKRLGIALDVCEKVLNHTSGSHGGIVAVYQHHDYADEKRVALEAWGRHVERIVNQQKNDGNVVALTRTAAK